MKKIFVSILLSLLLCCGCSNSTYEQSSTYELSSTSEQSNFKVYFFNVGHGDSALVMCDGYNAIIDCGSNGAADSLYLLNFKYFFENEINIESFDYVFCTHPDKDHYSMFADIISDKKVGKVYCSAKSSDVNKEKFNEFENSFKTIFKSIKVPSIGDKFSLGTATIEVLSVNSVPYSENSNDSSIVLMITYGDNKFLFTGDAQYTTEQMIIDSGIDIKCDILKIAHHGSSTSTSKKFLETAKPKYAIFSVSDSDNIDANIIKNLEKIGAKYWRTDEEGTIICESDGKKIKITRHDDGEKLN
jgi:competence protein ComEC